MARPNEDVPASTGTVVVVPAFVSGWTCKSSVQAMVSLASKRPSPPYMAYTLGWSPPDKNETGNVASPFASGSPGPRYVPPS